jgi:putative CocE/NonD family hydrolase
VRIPVFLQSGWFDPNGIGAKLAYDRLKKGGNGNVKLVIGPWGHTDLASNAQTGKDWGPEADIDLPRQYIRWFDFWLKGKDTGVSREPSTQIYIMNSRKWLTGDSWPHPSTRFQKLYFTSDTGANTLRGDGKLAWSMPEGNTACDTYIYDPADPTPSWISRAAKEGRKSYEEITAQRPDILVFDSAPLDSSLTIAGPLSAVLYASSSATDTDWFVTLIALTDRGAPVPLGNQFGKGCIRARYRKSLAMPEFLEPGKVYDYTISLWHTGITIPKGWKLRAEITSAFFPYYSRNLNTGGNNETDTALVRAEQKVFHSREYPSHLLLPVIEEKILTPIP